MVVQETPVVCSWCKCVFFRRCGGCSRGYDWRSCGSHPGCCDRFCCSCSRCGCRGGSCDWLRSIVNRNIGWNRKISYRNFVPF